MPIDPTFFMSLIEIIPDIIEKSTIGTTMNLRRLRNIVPQGLPFIDTRCNIDPDSDNIIIYGHNMKDGSMFASIIDYQDKSYFEDHPVIRYDTPDEVREYQVMSVFYDRMYYTDETDVFKFYDFIDADDEADYDYAIEQYLKKSVYNTGVKAHYGDKLLTLVTCAYHTENGRFVVVDRRFD